MENLKSNSWLIDSNVENALERKWNVVSSRWKCVNFSSTLELESPRVVVFQKQKNRKMVWLSAQVRVKERVHIFMKGSCPKGSLPSAKWVTPFFLFCHALSSAPFIFPIFPPPFLPFHILSLSLPSQFPLCFSPLTTHLPPCSILSLPSPFTKFRCCWTWPPEERPHWADGTVRASFCLLSHSSLERGGISKSCWVGQGIQ